MVITETWLHLLIPEAVVQLAGDTNHQQDQNTNSSKSRRGGLCIYVHNNCCTNSRVVAQHWSPDLEAQSVVCRPFYLPWELTVVTVIAVYILPNANVSTALSHLLDIVNKQQCKHFNGIHVVAVDFNQACLRIVLPSFVQHVNCATKKKLRKKLNGSCLFQHKASPQNCSLSSPGSIKSYFTACVHSPLQGKQGQTWALLKPGQKQLFLRARIVSNGLTCLNRITWKNTQRPACLIFEHCIDSVTVERRIRTFPNQKPWMTSKVKRLLKDQNTALRSRDKEW